MSKWGDVEVNRIFQEQDAEAVLNALEDSRRLDAWFALQAGMVTDMGSLPRNREEFDYILEVMQRRIKKAINEFGEAGKI